MEFFVKRINGILPCLVFFVSLWFQGAVVAGETWTFLPGSPSFEAPLADPREPQSALTAYLDKTRYEGCMGTPVELVRFEPGDGTRWGWGLFGNGRILLSQSGLAFPMLAGDWDAGTYLALDSGPFSNRLAFKHRSSHLGDSLQAEVLSTPLEPIFFSREALYWTGIFRASEDLRFNAGLGAWYNMAPKGDPWFASLGLEAFSPSLPLLDHPLRGYVMVEFLWKGENEGAWNKDVQAGLQWKLEKEGSRALRLALTYHAGRSEYGQFYLSPDEHLGVSLFFDP